MKQAAVEQAIKDGKVAFINPEPQAPPQPIEKPDDMAKFVALLEGLRRHKHHLTAHPTANFKPKNLLEQIQFVDTGTGQYLDIYINGHWYSIATTLIV